MRIDIAGIQVDNVTTAEALDRIRDSVKSGQPHQVVTAYSEFVVEAQGNAAFRDAVNRAALVLPDGIGVVWAAKFLSQPRRGPLFTCLSWIGSLALIFLLPRSAYSVIREKVSGSRLVWDIARLAAENGYSLALYGGFAGVAEKAAERLKEKFPNLKIALAASDQPFDNSAVRRIAASNSDILLVAYQPPRQELWISENLPDLNAKVAIGLGGTFDYLSGKRQTVPSFMNAVGLEWLWRLLTQPWRWRRMWNAIPVFSWIILKTKLSR